MVQFDGLAGDFDMHSDSISRLLDRAAVRNSNVMEDA
jgi:hypothetical protein